LINAGKLSDDDVKTYDDFMLLHEDLKRGVVDIQGGEDAVISLLRLEAEQKGEEPLVVVYNQPGYPVGFVANLDSDALVDQINIALAQLTYEGKIAALKAKWKFE
jgi:ABC-type amino acid transport substrate-binding protein